MSSVVLGTWVLKIVAKEKKRKKTQLNQIMPSS
jgi:hypothetical protein